MALVYPLVNGVRYDHSSLDIKLSGLSYFGVKSLDYTDNLEPGEVYGTGAQIVGRTRGQYKASGSVELYRAEFDDFVGLLGRQFPNVGIMECVWNIDVHYLPEGGLPMVTDNIIGCRIKSPANSSSGGSEALAVKLDLHVMYILRNGVAPITGLRR